MARTVSHDAHPLVGWLRGLAGQLTVQRAGLRTYQWLWILLCMLGALAVAAPRLLSQPVLYQAFAETRFDIGRYGGLYVAGQPGPDFGIAISDATEALRQNALARRELRFGSPDYRVVYQAQAAGVVQVQGIAPSATEAQMLANAGAEELVRQVRAAGGREILRNMMGWELWLALQPQGARAPDRFEALLREIVRLQAFPMSLPLEPVSTPRTLASLPAEEQNDLTRALESRYDLWRFEINIRNARLDAYCGTAGLTTTGAREAALQTCAARDRMVGQELEARNRAVERMQAIAAALDYAVREQGLRFRPDEVSAAYRLVADLPTTPMPRNIGMLLVLALLLGLAFGVVGVAVDRSAKVLPKLRELWYYRELIRNLVLRDLKSRYKGSALGYLWTQLAPLLMMLLFWVVFSFVFQSSLAMFPIFLIVALLPWNYCAEAVSGGARSVIDNANLVKKVFFPREVLPLVSVFSSLLNYLLSLPVMFLVMAIVQWFYPPLEGQLNFSWTFAYLPVLLIIQTIFLIGVAMFLSTLAVFFRDTVHLIGILVQFWFFLTPVVYALDTVAAPLARVIRWLNPMASLIEFYREILYGNAVTADLIPTTGLPALTSVLRVFVTALLVLVIGYWFFQRHSGRFGEEI